MVASQLKTYFGGECSGMVSRFVDNTNLGGVVDSDVHKRI